jgi:hypothetical protein
MKYYDVGRRIRERLVALGYIKPSGDLDVERFSWDHRLGRTNLYNWLGDKAVPFKDLATVCDALQCSPYWLLTGREQVFPKALPRRHRGGVKGLLLALAVGAAAALWPSGSAEAHPLLVGKANFRLTSPLDRFHLIGSWRRFRNVLAGFGGGLVYA